MSLENFCNIFFQSRSKFQSTEIEFKLTKFDDSKRGHVGILVRYEDVIVNIANILIIENNNYLLFKNNVEYVWARFI